MTREDILGSLNSSSISEPTVASSACLKLVCVDVEPLCILVFGVARRVAEKGRDEIETEPVSTAVTTPFSQRSSGL